MSHIAPEGPVYQAGTLSANPVAMAAGYAALQQCLADNFYEDQEERTRYLCKALQSHADQNGYPLSMVQMGSIFWLSFSKERISKADQIKAAGMEYFKELHHELLQLGVYLGPSGYEVGFVSSAHTIADLDQGIEKMNRALDTVFKDR